MANFRQVGKRGRVATRSGSDTVAHWESGSETTGKASTGCQAGVGKQLERQFRSKAKANFLEKTKKNKRQRNTQ